MGMGIGVSQPSPVPWLNGMASSLSSGRLWDPLCAGYRFAKAVLPGPIDGRE